MSDIEKADYMEKAYYRLHEKIYRIEHKYAPQVIMYLADMCVDRENVGSPPTWEDFQLEENDPRVVARMLVVAEKERCYDQQFLEIAMADIETLSYYEAQAEYWTRMYYHVLDEYEYRIQEYVKMGMEVPTREELDASV